MSDHDRLMAYAERVLEDGCQSCGFSRVYCHAVAYIEGPPARCCDNCSGH